MPISRLHGFLIATLAAAACGGAPAEEQPPASTSAAESTATQTPAQDSVPVIPADTPADSAQQDTAPPRIITSHDTARVPRVSPVAPSETTGTATTQQDVPRLLRQTAQAYSGMRTLRARFDMETENPLLRSRTQSRGTLYQRRPDRILLRFEEPDGDLILSDGEHFWVYYPSTTPDQVIRAAATAGAAGGVDLWAQFVGDPLARFEHTFHGTETVGGRETAAITLDPRGDPGYRQLKVWIDTRDHLVRRFEITENNGVIRRVRLHDLEINPALAVDVFRFTPPPGVRIIER